MLQGSTKSGLVVAVTSSYGCSTKAEVLYLALQAGVDRNRRLGKGNDVFVPAGSDRGVVTLQRWLHKYAGDTLPVPEVQPPALSRRELLDR